MTGAKGTAREKILNAAIFLFQRQGYHATGLNEIIKKSGAPKGSLYYYFPIGKEELAAEAIKLIGKDSQRHIEATLAKYDDPVQAAQMHIRDVADFVFDKERENRFTVGLLALETSSMSELLRKANIQVFDLYADTLYRSLIRCGLKEKKARECSLIIQVMIEGAIILSLTRNDNSRLLMIAEQIPLLLK